MQRNGKKKWYTYIHVLTWILIDSLPVYLPQQEVLTESFESSEKKTAKKKKNGVLEETTVTSTKTKKSKKSKKSDEKENHISVVSGKFCP